jgi:hypothetical protein
VQAAIAIIAMAAAMVIACRINASCLKQKYCTRTSHAVNRKSIQLERSSIALSAKEELCLALPDLSRRSCHLNLACRK